MTCTCWKAVHSDSGGDVTFSAVVILFKLRAYLTPMSLCVVSIHSKRPCTPTRQCCPDVCAKLCVRAMQQAMSLQPRMQSHAYHYMHAHWYVSVCMCVQVHVCACVRMYTYYKGSFRRLLAGLPTGVYLGRVPLLQGCVSLSLDGVHVSHSPLSPPSLSFQSSLQHNHTELSSLGS